ncbi:DNA-formamidopyrimidine glycosylase family protein [Actinospongicola halichondriae]|uniref:DNA-formamidopyrimidine glycosylase family protein n=1 Tax=Actinospongicola halichondriae TaxID=3236844 RepID=UPI003D4F3100
MPEIIEIETYRRQADLAVGRQIVAVPTLDPLGLRGEDPEAVRSALVGVRITATDRIGKLLLLETDGPTIGLRFGMTGRLLVDGSADIERLEYGGQRDEPAWDRTVIDFDRGSLRVRDPRRLGGLELDPDRSRLGPDAATVSGDELRRALDSSRAALKSRLLDQRRLAGLGNLLVDETLWRAGLDPARPAGELPDAVVDDLAAAIVATVADLSARGGSHTGDLQPARERGASCPRDGTPLDRRTIGGRTTYSCPLHQR